LGTPKEDPLEWENGPKPALKTVPLGPVARDTKPARRKGGSALCYVDSIC
jgi:hypothetical protein